MFAAAGNGAKEKAPRQIRAGLQASIKQRSRLLGFCHSSGLFSSFLRGASYLKSPRIELKKSDKLKKPRAKFAQGFKTFLCYLAHILRGAICLNHHDGFEAPEYSLVRRSVKKIILLLQSPSTIIFGKPGEIPFYGIIICAKPNPRAESWLNLPTNR